MGHRFSPGDLVFARGREWVALPSPADHLLALRPLSGSEEDAVLLDPRLEITEVKPARFDLPVDAIPTRSERAGLLADALRLTLRRGAGPFRSAAHLTFEPRGYQLVPLMMALRLPVPRLLIADDVGIGKTIEAGLILRELIDRGEVDAFAVLCPPHLVEQWVRELKNRFGIDAVAVTSSSAARLERGLPLDQTLFSANPFTVVSLDYIKAEKRREDFARACPDFVIVDEAHSCTGTTQGRHQRFALLQGLVRKEQRALLLLTATPHSGDEEAFSRLLSLIHPDFAVARFDDAKYRERLARHFVQRRRVDVTTPEWDEGRTFPRHMSTDAPYRLNADHRLFHEAVLDYCLGVVNRAGEGQRERRLAFWGTLAIMRCVGSSPAAALSALRTRAGAEERLEPQIYDDEDDEDGTDVEPVPFTGDADLSRLLSLAETLKTAPDPKVQALVSLLKPLIAKGANPVVFCRFIATADHVRDALRKAFPKLEIQAVTGALTPDDRRDRVALMGEAPQRLLVATDCLSEGINLQQHFDTVVHYDLSWNPTRHQQREGRVDRFGQAAEEVHSLLMFSPDSAIDGAVLDVILNKARAIQKATGVTVPLPDERGPVTDALMAAMMLKRGHKQMAFDLRLEDGTQAMAVRWHDAEEKEKRSRTIFAQNAMRASEVLPEWQKARDLMGDGAAVLGFVGSALKLFDAPMTARKTGFEAPLPHLPQTLRERLEERGLKGTKRLAVSEPCPSDATLLTRTHPLTECLAEALVEGALDPKSLPDLDMGRIGAWETAAVSRLTRVVLLRLRFKLTIHGRRERLLLAEEAAIVALQGATIIATADAARALIAAPVSGEIAPSARDRQMALSHAALAELMAPISAHAQARAETLLEDHGRLRQALGVTRVTVEPALPPDVIGLFTLLPSED
ncbi:DEAD/DEAH box helicase [Rhodobacter sp. KR11]|uniref:DEAD/DEAH box helicase n=1 Tax=Rhodobacter sp. KR11 TaxID=2974588 RepID=UPI002223A78C|nr:DEAD/DEAH box helicase [Rhodobacter sp. KR11]MCW1919230.1 DEAD/DEAH box helicase [Rhodobacter sp. KR11]